MPGNSTTNSWLFPPETREVQFDEKWSFVEKKEHHCDPEDPGDAQKGDPWDRVALDAAHRLVVSVVPGKRTANESEVERDVTNFSLANHGGSVLGTPGLLLEHGALCADRLLARRPA